MGLEKAQNKLNEIKLLFEPNSGSNGLTFPIMCRFIRETVSATQSAIAKKLNSALCSYQQWEYGNRNPVSKAAANITFMYFQCLCLRESTSKTVNIEILSKLLLAQDCLLCLKKGENKLENLKLLFELQQEINGLTFSLMCRLIRETMNVTQANMAERLGVTFSAYQQWEYGKQKPSSKAAANLTLMYLQCLYIKKQTPSLEQVNSLLSSFVDGTTEQICA